MWQAFKKGEAGIFVVSCGLLFGAFLRFYDLSLIGGWSDELATLWYAKHPLAIFTEETHPPLFYLLNFFTAFSSDPLLTARALSGGLCFLVLLLCLRQAIQVLGGSGALFLELLLSLSYTDIVQARMARQYSLFSNLTVLLLLLSEVPGKEKARFIVSLILCWIHPCGLLVPGTLAIAGLREKKLRDLKPYLFPIATIALYYGLKFIILGKVQVLQNYYKGAERSDPFLVDIFFAVAGDHFPKFISAPVHPFALSVTGLYVLSFMAGLFWLRWKTKTWDSLSLKILLLIGVSLSFAELFSLAFFDITRGRYYLFLLPAIFIGLARIYGNIRLSWTFAFMLPLLTIVLLNPLTFYPGEREAFLSFKKVKTENPDIHLVMCGNKYQYDYYLKETSRNCLQELAGPVNDHKRLYLLDLNGTTREIYKKASETHEIENFRTFGVSTAAIATVKSPAP